MHTLQTTQPGQRIIIEDFHGLTPAKRLQEQHEGAEKFDEESAVQEAPIEMTSDNHKDIREGNREAHGVDPRAEARLHTGQGRPDLWLSR